MLLEFMELDKQIRNELKTLPSRVPIQVVDCTDMYYDIYKIKGMINFYRLDKNYDNKDYIYCNSRKSGESTRFITRIDGYGAIVDVLGHTKYQSEVIKIQLIDINKQVDMINNEQWMNAINKYYLEEINKKSTRILV